MLLWCRENGEYSKANLAPNDATCRDFGLYDIVLREEVEDFRADTAPDLIEVGGGIEC